MNAAKERLAYELTKLVHGEEKAGAGKSKREARRLIEGGGVKSDEEKIESANAELPASAKERGEFVLHKGKKTHIRVILK